MAVVRAASAGVRAAVAAALGGRGRAGRGRGGGRGGDQGRGAERVNGPAARGAGAQPAAGLVPNQAEAQGAQLIEGLNPGNQAQDQGLPPPHILPPPPPNAHQIHFRAMLRRLDFNNQAITALEGFGLDSLEAIYDLTEDDIPAITKELRRTRTVIKQSSQNFLQALRYWTMRQERLQRNYIPQDFNELVMRTSLQRWKNSILKVPDDLVKEPEPFKPNTKWREFSEAFTTFLQHTKGQCDFSLSYIIRENDAEEDLGEATEEDYNTIDAYEEAIVPLMGPHYDLDNHMVFDSLKSHLLNGPAWTWVQDYDSKRDGRSAWKALQAHFEGIGGQIRIKLQPMHQSSGLSIRGQRISTSIYIKGFTRKRTPT